MKLIKLTCLVGCIILFSNSCKKKEPELTEKPGPELANPGDHPVPNEAGLEDSSSPDHVVGNGTPASCTCQAFVDAVAQGGVITFDCGSAPHTIVMDQTAKIFNN